MGNSPPECFGVKCPCGQELPPCRCWNEVKGRKINREVDCVYAYIYLGGKYYRHRGTAVYLCPKCFWKPRDDYKNRIDENLSQDVRKEEECQVVENAADMKLEVDKRRRENQERMNEISMRGEQIWMERKKQREEERQKQTRKAHAIMEKFKEQQKKAMQQQSELAMRKVEVKAEEDKVNVLAGEEYKRFEKRREKGFLAPKLREQKEREAQLQVQKQQSKKENKSQVFSSWALNGIRRNVHQTVQVETYNSLRYLENVEVFGTSCVYEEDNYSEVSESSLSSTSELEKSSTSEDFSDENYSSEEFDSESFTDNEDDNIVKDRSLLETEFQGLSLLDEDYRFDDSHLNDFHDIPSDNSLEIAEEFEKITEFIEEIISIVFEMQPNDDYLDMDWLESVQVQMLWYYALTQSLSPIEKENMLHYLTIIQSNLSTKECLFLTKATCMLNSCDPLEFDLIPTALTTDPTSEFLSKLIHSGYVLDFSNSICMENCLKALVSLKIENLKLQEFILLTSSWSTYDRFTFLQICKLKCVPQEHQAEILHTIQVYNVPPQVVSNFGQAPDNIFEALKTYTREELEKDLEITMQEIKETGLIEPETLDIVEKVMTFDDRKLTSVIRLDYRKYLTSAALEKAKSALKSCDNNSVLDVDGVSDAIVTLACAVKNKKPFCPRMTQLIALTILIVSHTKSINRLLEVLTGEGKSCIIAMFAAVLAIQGKDVDIITSSPILADRDADEWKDYYETFDLEVADNTSIGWEATPLDVDERRRCCYRKQIVYGTISNFAADVLREEFEQKEIRCDRKFEAVIADEVDLLMLDEGIQLTYLSHDASLLHHTEPVLAAVWSVIGQYIPAPTVNSGFLYVGRAKHLVDAIFDSLDSSVISHLVRDSPDGKIDSSLILNIALETGLIDESTLTEIKQAKDLQTKIKAFNSVNPQQLLLNLEDYVPYKFQIYTLEGGVLNSLMLDEHEEGEDEQKQETARILCLNNGMACTLNTSEEIRDWARAKLESKLQFTDSCPCKTDEKEKTDLLQLPSFLETFLKNQLPVFVESALQCLQMVENREYAVKDGQIIPVDFMNSGVMETNKKWGSGLQQMLEMKHRVRVSPMSVITNFMSHTELFSRYKHNGSIFGLTGTLGLDSPTTRTVLCDLFDVNVCSIPTHIRRKLFERPEVFVHGDTKKWFKEIINAIDIAIKPALPYKHGRAVLVLCEDIKTAQKFRNYVLKCKDWSERKVKIYANSSSDEVKMVINQTFYPGEIVIATNLAGRGTDIKVTREVNKSGGLLCLLTFLPRNRRVELQAFGRTARKGEPGSVQCILKSSSLSPHYHNLNLEDIRSLRDQEEQLRLDQLIQSDIQEVQLRERLFKIHCEFLGNIHQQIKDRDDKATVIDSLNEAWGQWLQMKKDHIENLEHELLVKELKALHQQWQPDIPDDPSDFVDVPVANFYHLIKFGNSLLSTQEKANAERAVRYYTRSIQMMPRYALIAHYYCAYCSILIGKGNYINEAIDHLTESEKCIDVYIEEVTTVLQCVAITSQLRQPVSEHDQDNQEDEPSAFLEQLQDKTEDDNFSLQMQVRMQILDNIRKNIHEALQKLNMYKKNYDVQAKALGVFSLLPDTDYITNREICAIWNLGLEVVFSVEKKPRFCWEGLLVCLLGAVEIIAGVLLTVFTVGTAASVGMFLISEGISDCIDGVVAMIKGEFSWAEWGISKATSIAISLVTGGIASFASKGTKSLNIGAKLAKIGKELKAIPQVAKMSWGIALKDNIKNAAKYVIKEIAQQAIMRGISYAEDKAFESIAHTIGKKCGENMREMLQSSFTKGNLGYIVDQTFLTKLSSSCSLSDLHYKDIEKEAFEFFEKVGEHTVSLLVTHSEIRQRLTSASLSFLSEMSQKHKSGKWYYVAGEVMISGSCIAKTVHDLKILIDAFIPEMVKVCERSLGVPVRDLDSTRDDHACALTLKQRLSNHLSDVFGEAVSSLLQQDAGFVVSHALNRTVNHVGKKFLSEKVKFLRNSKELEEIRAGQHANYIRAVDIFSSEVSHRDKHMVDQYVEKVANLDHPGSLLELRAAVEHYGKGVTIYQEVNGKMKKHCSIDPTSSVERRGTPNLELVFTPPSNKKSKDPGHYNVLVEGVKKTVVNSKSNNCLFEAFSCGMYPSHTAEDQQRLAKQLRKEVVTMMSSAPYLWQRHISYRVKMEQLSRGNYYALVGAGPAKKRNVMSKILPPTYKEVVDEEDKNTLITTYKQANGIICEAKRVYDQPIMIERDDNGTFIANENLKLLYMTVEMKGLNLEKNKGMRCWDTQPVSGMIKRDLKRVRKGNKGKESAVSFHLCPSEAGACAGNTYANSVMTSPNYNKLERDIWTPELRKWIGKEDFRMRIEVNTGPIVPENIGRFITNANVHRRAQDREEIHATNADALLQRFKKIEEIDPRAFRVRDIKGTIVKRGSKDSKSFTMPTDHDLFVPSKYSEPNQPLQYGNELSKAKRKIDRQKFNCPPKYQTPPNARKKKIHKSK